MTRSSFRSAWRTVIFTAGTVALAATWGVVSLDAQGAAFQPRLSIDSGIEAGDAGPSLSGTRVGVELTHERRGARGLLRVWSGATAERWWEGGMPRSVAGAADVTGNLTLTRRMRMDFSDRVSYAPLDLFGTFGAAAVPGAPPSVLSGSEFLFRRTLSNTASISLSRTVGTRGQVVLSGTHAYSTNDFDQVMNSSVTARFLRRLGRFTGWHASYGAGLSSSTQIADQAAGLQQNADLGFDYSRPLPFAPRTTMTISAGGAVLEDVTGRRARIDASAGLTRRVTEGWAMSAGYSRPVEYVTGIAQPLVMDAVRVSASGLLPLRISVSLDAGASSGSVGVVGGSSFVSYVGSAHVSRQFGRQWSVDFGIHDSWYRFDESPGPGIPPAFARRGLRAALVWAPGRSYGGGH